VGSVAVVDVLERGQGAVCLLTANLEGERPTHRPLDPRPLVQSVIHPPLFGWAAILVAVAPEVGPSGDEQSVQADRQKHRSGGACDAGKRELAEIA
jgi:hypothetical protein